MTQPVPLTEQAKACEAKWYDFLGMGCQVVPSNVQQELVYRNEIIFLKKSDELKLTDQKGLQAHCEEKTKKGMVKETERCACSWTSRAKIIGAFQNIQELNRSFSDAPAAKKSN